MPNETPLEVVSTHQFPCGGFETNYGLVKPRNSFAVPAIVTTFRDGMARVSCPNFQQFSGVCSASLPLAVCPYSHQEKAVDDEQLNTRSIDELLLSTRTRNCLMQRDIITIGQLRNRSEAQLLLITNFGEVCLNEVRAKLLQKFGLRLKDPFR